MATLGAFLNGDFKNLVPSKILEPAVGLEPTKTALQTVAFAPWLHWLVRVALLPLADTMPGEFCRYYLERGDHSSQTRSDAGTSASRCWDRGEEL